MPSRVVPADALDLAAAARGGFRGFLVLMLGTLMFPLVADPLPWIGAVWLTLVCVAAFAFAGSHQGCAHWPALQGAVTATGALALMLPLVLFSPATRDPVPLLLTGLTAPAVGAVTGLLIVLYKKLKLRVSYGHTKGSGIKR